MYRGRSIVFFDWGMNFRISSIILSCGLGSFPIPVDTGRKLNVHETFRRSPGRLLNVLCTFNLSPASTGIIVVTSCIHDIPRALISARASTDNFPPIDCSFPVRGCNIGSILTSFVISCIISPILLTDSVP